MEEIRDGDAVTRISHGGDIFFRVETIEQRQGCAHAILHALCHRLCADAPLKDLERKGSVEIDLNRQEQNRQYDQAIMQTMTYQEQDYQPLLQSPKNRDFLDTDFLTPRLETPLLLNLKIPSCSIDNVFRVTKNNWIS